MEKGVVRKIKFIFTKNLFTKYERGEPPAVSMKYGLLLADPLQAKGAGVCLWFLSVPLDQVKFYALVLGHTVGQER